MGIGPGTGRGGDHGGGGRPRGSKDTRRRRFRAPAAKDVPVALRAEFLAAVREFVGSGQAVEYWQEMLHSSDPSRRDRGLLLGLHYDLGLPVARNLNVSLHGSAEQILDDVYRRRREIAEAPALTATVVKSPDAPLLPDDDDAVPAITPPAIECKEPPAPTRVALPPIDPTKDRLEVVGILNGRPLLGRIIK